MKKQMQVNDAMPPANWADMASSLTCETIHPSTNCMIVKLTVVRTLGTARCTTSPTPHQRAGSGVAAIVGGWSIEAASIADRRTAARRHGA